MYEIKLPLNSLWGCILGICCFNPFCQRFMHAFWFCLTNIMLCTIAIRHTIEYLHKNFANYELTNIFVQASQSIPPSKGSSQGRGYAKQHPFLPKPTFVEFKDDIWSDFCNPECITNLRRKAKKDEYPEIQWFPTCKAQVCGQMYLRNSTFSFISAHF